MTRDDLQAVCYRELAFHGRRLSEAGDDPKARTEIDNTLVDTFLAAAEQYAAYVGGITAERRAVLDPVPETSHAKGPVRVHYKPPGGSYVLCGTPGTDIGTIKTTVHPEAVTCWRCARNRAFPQTAGAR